MSDGKSISKRLPPGEITANGTRDTVLDLSPSRQVAGQRDELEGLGVRMRVLMDESFSSLLPDVLTNMRRLALDSEKDEVQLKASLRVLDHFSAAEARQPVTAIQINTNIEMPEIPVAHGTEKRAIEIGGIKVAAPRKQRERKIVMAREEEWRTKSEKAIESKVVEKNPSAIGISPAPRTVSVVESVLGRQGQPHPQAELPRVKLLP